MQDLLTQTAESFFSSLPLAIEEEDLLEHPDRWIPVPSIDADDGAEIPHPDRSLLWTTYQRSYVSFGGKPFLQDERYLALFTRCLGAACELVLALEPDASGAFPHRVRQTTLLKALIEGTAALGFSTAKRAEYFRYHRDWLVRFTALVDLNSPMEPIFEVYENKLEKTGSAAVDRLRGFLQQQTERAAGLQASAGGSPWQRSVREFHRYIESLCASAEYWVDPYASDPVFTPLFKVFHGLGNQLGLKPVEEGFAHHLLLHAHQLEVVEAEQDVVVAAS